MKNRIFACSLAAVLAATAALAAPSWTPIQIGISGPSCQIFGEETAVTGLRLNLAASRNDTVTGIDLGLISLGDDIRGIRLNLFNTSDWHFSGLEAGICNREAAFSGLAVGLFNAVDGDASGILVGAFNKASVMTGLQIGLFNQATSLRGVQIGLINLVDDGPLTFFPIINMAF